MNYSILKDSLSLNFLEYETEKKSGVLKKKFYIKFLRSPMVIIGKQDVETSVKSAHNCQGSKATHGLGPKL